MLTFCRNLAAEPRCLKREVVTPKPGRDRGGFPARSGAHWGLVIIKTVRLKNVPRRHFLPGRREAGSLQG